MWPLFFQKPDRNIESLKINSQADDCADLQIGGVFRYFRNEEVSLAIFNHQTPHLKFYEETDFLSFRANKSTERKLVLSLSLSGKVP